jgi:MscS family membrane protein
VDDEVAVTTVNTLMELGLAPAVVLLFTVGGRLLLYFAERSIRRIARRSDMNLDQVVISAVHTPIFWAIILLGVTIAKQQITLIPERWSAVISGILFVLISLALYIAAYRLLRDLLDWYMHRLAGQNQTMLDTPLLPLLRHVLITVLSVVTLIIVLQHFDVRVGTLLATLGVGSLAFALAAQATLSDMIAGFLILVDQRYRIGDRIELIDEGIIGDVVEIGLRTTHILTMDRRLVIIPNSMIANNMVINHAYPDPMLRVDLPLGVAYGSDIAHVKRVLLQAIQQVPGVSRERQSDVIFQGFGDSALDLLMRCWIDAYADKPRMVDRINEAAYNALNREGIEIPFPQRTLWHRVEPEAVPTLRAALDGQEHELPARRPASTLDHQTSTEPSTEDE